MKQLNEAAKPAKTKKRTKNFLIAAAILLLGGYLFTRIVNGLRLDDPLYDDSYDFMM